MLSQTYSISKALIPFRRLISMIYPEQRSIQIKSSEDISIPLEKGTYIVDILTPTFKKVAKSIIL